MVGPIGGGGGGSSGGGSGSGGTGGGSTPPGYDPNCQMLPDQQCTIASIIENYGGEDSKTKVGADGSGCRSLTYTGTQVNNPLKIALHAKDIDGNNQLRGAVMWLSKGNIKTGIVNISPTHFKARNCFFATNADIPIFGTSQN